MYVCEEITERIDVLVKEPVEEWIEQAEERCEEQECNWLLLCTNKLVCWLVVETVEIVTTVAVWVIKTVTRTVCTVVAGPLISFRGRLEPVLCASGIQIERPDRLDAAAALMFDRISRAVYDDPTAIDLEPIESDLAVRAYFFADRIGLYPVDTHVYLLEEPAANRLIVAFRGTEGFSDWKDWVNNASFDPVPYGGPYIEVHGGFLAAYSSVRVQLGEAISTRLQSNTAAESPVEELCFTGHSLGGALATLAASEFRRDLPDDVAITVHTFGAPKVGSLYFTFDYNGLLPNSYRVVNQGDPVPEFPPTETS